jgi:PadR family transcriptional regulator, regulatory protein PadR
MGHVMEPLELTPTMTAIIKIFLAEPDRPHYGMEIMRRTGLSSGSVYPALAAFRKHRWLTVGTEDIDPHTEGRPPRRFYKITGDALTAARIQLAALREFYSPPAVRPRLITEGGAR